MKGFALGLLTLLMAVCMALLGSCKDKPSTTSSPVESTDTGIELPDDEF